MKVHIPSARGKIIPVLGSAIAPSECHDRETMSFLARFFPLIAGILLTSAVAGSTVCFALGLTWVAASILLASLIVELACFGVLANSSPAARRNEGRGR